METMTNDRQQVVFGMPVSGREWMSTTALSVATVSEAGAGRKRVCADGTAVSAHGYLGDIAFITDVVPGPPAWSPPI